MPEPRPFTTFNFLVNLREPGNGPALCEAGFAECDGLEMNLAPKTIREGGNNGRMIHLTGPISYGQISLKRGMTDDLDLWDWFERSQTEPGLRASGEVMMLGSDRQPVLQVDLSGCLPVKLKVPGLNAKDGQIAIEEMQLAYETLAVRAPAQADNNN